MQSLAITAGNDRCGVITGAEVGILIACLRAQREVARDAHTKLCKEPHQPICTALVKYMADITILETRLHQIAG